MRGIVYRLGRRRTGSVLLALGVALTFGLGSVPSALAKTAQPAHVLPALSHAALVSSLRPPAKKGPVAHAAGHKIA